MRKILWSIFILCMLAGTGGACALVAQAQTTAEEGCTVKLYGDDQFLETKWYKWGEKIELPEYYQRDYIKDGSEVKTETIYIREWKWQDSKGSISCAVDRNPQLTVSKELSLTENGEIEVKGYSRVDSAYINQAKVLVKFCVGGEIVKTAWYAQGDTVYLPSDLAGKNLDTWWYQGTYTDSDGQTRTRQVWVVWKFGASVLPRGIYERTFHVAYKKEEDTTTETPKKSTGVFSPTKRIEKEDKTPPVIKNIKNKKKYKKSKVTVYVKDNDELYKVTVNGKKVKLKKTKKGKYKGYYQFTLKRKKKTKKYKITAMDITDNRTTKTIWICKKKK